MHFKPDPNMPKEEINENINRIFFQRNDTFWNLLWKYLPTFSPNQLPFNSTFCVGSGKQKYVYGKVTKADPWYNLRKQRYQLSIPTAHKIIEHDFSDAFHGGSSLRLTSNKILRLFSTDFVTSKDIILICAHKGTSEETSVNFYLKTFEPISEKYSIVVCGSGSNDSSDKLICSPVTDEEKLKSIYKKLPQGSEYLNVGRTSINDWQIK